MREDVTLIKWGSPTHRLRALLTWALMGLCLMALSVPEEVEARRRGFSSSRSSRSRSSRSSRSSSRRSSWSGSSSSRRKGGSFSGTFRSSSSLGRTRARSSTRSSPRARSSSNTRTRSSSRTRSRARSTRYQSTGYRDTRYRQRAPRYRERYGSWWSRPSRLKTRWRSTPSYRYRFRDRYYGGGYSVGVWDVLFLSHASSLFWYHHWHEPSIRRALYQDNLLKGAELRRLEAEVHALEAQNIARDPDYLPDGVSPQDAYNDAYIRQIRDEEQGSSLWLILFGSVFGGALLGYLLFFRRY